MKFIVQVPKPQLNKNWYDAVQYNIAHSVSTIFLFLLHINFWHHKNAYLILIFSARLCTQAVQVSANKYSSSIYSKVSQLGVADQNLNRGNIIAVT